MFSFHKILRCAATLFGFETHDVSRGVDFSRHFRPLVLQELEDRCLLSATSAFGPSVCAATVYDLDDNAVVMNDSSELSNAVSCYPVQSWQSDPVYRQHSDAQGNDFNQLVNPEDRLDFAQPASWHDSLLLSSCEDDFFGRTVFLAGNEIFLHFAFGNHGNTESDAFTLSVYIDGSLARQFQSLPLGGLEFRAVSNVSLGSFVSGVHELNVVLEDTSGNILARAIEFQMVESLDLAGEVSQIDSRWDVNRGDYQLTWSQATGADRYRIEYATTQELLEAAPTVVETSGTELYLAGIKENDSCFAKIITINDSGATVGTVQQVTQNRALSSSTYLPQAASYTDKNDPFNITYDFRTSGNVIYYYQSGIATDSTYTYVPAPDNVYFELIEAACQRWQEIIVSGFDNLEIYSGQNSMSIDDIHITFGFASTDDSFLGWSYSDGYWRESNLRANGSIVYNTKYYGANPSEAKKTNFYYVVLHEIAHSLGYSDSCWTKFGTYKQTSQLPQGLETVLDNTSSGFTIPYYTGANVLNVLSDMSAIAPITINGSDVFLMETITSSGSYGAHLSSYYATFYEKSLGQHELMNYAASNSQYTTSLSPVTVAFLDDVGYDIDYAMADPFGTAAPYELTALRTESGINLAWSVDSDQITDSTTYSVERRDISSEGYSWVQVASGITTLTWTDTDVESADAWQYRVTARNLKTNVTLWSNYYSGGETLSWDAASGVSNYRIYQLRTEYTNNPYWALLTTTSQTSYTLDSNAESTIYMVVACGALQACSDPSRAVRNEIAVTLSNNEPQVGVTIHASATVPTANVTWQWYRGTNDTDMTPIDGATSSSYTVTESDRGCLLRAVAQAVYPWYGQASATTVSYVPGEIVSASLSTNSPLAGIEISVSVEPQQAVFSCQWYRGTNDADMTLINGANSSSYIPATADAGYRLQARIVAAPPYSGSLKLTTADVVTIPLSSENLILSIQKPLVGQTLEALWNSNDITATFQWYAGNSPTTMVEIPGETLQTLLITEAYRGQYLKLVATGSELYSGSASVETETVVKQNVTEVSIVADNLTVDSVLSAECLPSDATCSWQWFRSTSALDNMSKIEGATNRTYTLTNDDIGHFIRVVAMGTDEYCGRVEATTSSVVTSFLTEITFPDQLLFVGNEFVVSLLPTDANATCAWYRGTTKDEMERIPGAYGMAYTPVEEDLGYFLKVIATGTGYYSGEVSAVSDSVVVQGIGTITLSTDSPAAGDTINASLSSFATVSWQWFTSIDRSNWTPIPGADTNSYTVSSSNAGYYIGAQATGTGSSSGTAFASVTNYATAPFGSIFIEENDLHYGTELNASVTETNAKVSWQWYRGTDPDVQDSFSPIESATRASYTPGIDDVGFYLAVEAQGIAPWTGHDMIAATTPVTATITGATFDSTVFVAGSMITVSPLPQAATVDYQWYQRRNEDDPWIVIEGQTSSSYTPVDQDRGFYLMVELTGTGFWEGTTQTSTTSCVADQLAGLTLSTMSPYVNETVTATVDPASAPVSYQWYKGHTQSSMDIIPHATDQSYTPNSDDLGCYLQVNVTGQDNWEGSFSTMTSYVVRGKIGAVSLSNKSLAVGEVTTLLVKTLGGIVNDSYPVTTSYQWYRSSQSSWNALDELTLIENATCAEYRPTPLDVGMYLVGIVQGTGIWTETSWTVTDSPVTDSIGSLVLVPSSTLRSGDTLQALVSNSNATVAFQWFRSTVDEQDNTPPISPWTPIEGAVEMSYIVTDSDVGTSIKVVATGTEYYTGTAEAMTTRVEERSSLLVTTSDDTIDPYDCQTSLREAVVSATTGNTIMFASELSGNTIELVLGVIIIDKSITINATGSNPKEKIRIDAGEKSQIFSLVASKGNTIEIVLESLVLSHGRGTSRHLGGALYGERIHLTLINSSVVDSRASYGGGIYVTSGSVTAINSLIARNTAVYGGGIHAASSSVTAINSLITHNNAYNGGGIYCDNGVLSLTNCTVAANDANTGAGCYFASTEVILKDSIVAQNSGGADISLSSSANVHGTNVLSSFTSWSSDSTGTIVHDATLTLFANSQEGDFALVPTAQAVNRGSETTDLECDFNGDKRLQGSAVDLGALESVFQKIEASVADDSLQVINGCSALLHGMLHSTSGSLDDEFEYLWDVTGTGACFVPAQSQRWFTPDDYEFREGSHSVLLKIRDSIGSVSDPVTLVVTVCAAGRSFEIVPSTLIDGQVLKLNIRTSSPGREPVIGWSVDWDDGYTTSINVLSQSMSAAHYFAKPGVYRIRVSCMQGPADSLKIISFTAYDFVVNEWTNSDDSQAIQTQVVSDDVVQTGFPTASQCVTEPIVTPSILPRQAQSGQATADTVPFVQDTRPLHADIALTTPTQTTGITDWFPTPINELLLILDNTSTKNKQASIRRFTFVPQQANVSRPVPFNPEELPIALRDRLLAEGIDSPESLFDERDWLAFINENTTVANRVQEENFFITLWD